MLNNKLIRREISVLDYLMLTTGKVLVGIGIGIVFVSHFFYAQPYWFVWIIAGALILVPTLYGLMKAEEKEEKVLRKKLKK